MGDNHTLPTREAVARALHEAHKPWCDYTYPFEHEMSSRHVYEALADAALRVIACQAQAGDAAFNAGLEYAARYHDSEAERIRKICKPLTLAQIDAIGAHDEAAFAIRVRKRST